MPAVAMGMLKEPEIQERMLSETVKGAVQSMQNQRKQTSRYDELGLGGVVPCLLSSILGNTLRFLVGIGCARGRLPRPLIDLIFFLFLGGNFRLLFVALVLVTMLVTLFVSGLSGRAFVAWKLAAVLGALFASVFWFFLGIGVLGSA